MRSALFFLLILAGLRPVAAQSFFDLIYGAEVGDVRAVEITLPLDSLDAETPSDMPGTLIFTDSTGTARHLGVDVSLRGKFRRSRCSTPPLKLNFSKKELAGMGLAKHDKYKLVNTCYGDSAAVSLLLKEYLAYRAYALLSPAAHYRAQLLQLTFRDAAGRQADRVQYAMLLEDTDEMAERLGAVELDDADGLEAARYDAAAEATHALFQYLIGNADWSLALQRNVKIIKRPDGKLVPVAYDFDFSGWVGAPYASPSPQSGQQSIYHRVYLGYHQSERTLREVIQEYRKHRRELYGMINGFELLNKRDRTLTFRFVNLFYEALSEMNANTGTLLYDQLRGESASVIPPGSMERHYRSSARR